MDNTDPVDNPLLCYRFVHKVWTTKTCCSHFPQPRHLVFYRNLNFVPSNYPSKSTILRAVKLMIRKSGLIAIVVHLNLHIQLWS